MSKSKIAFYEKASWYHRTRIFNNDGTISYSKKGGFSSPQEAEESYYNMIYDFELAKKQYGINLRPKEWTFTEYLKYWLEELYKPKIKSTTAMVIAYVVYDLIIPNVEMDIKLNLVSEKYIINLLKRIKPITKTAANESRKVLFLALQDGRKDGYINYNPVKNITGFRQGNPKVKILNEIEIKKLLKVTKDSNWYLEILLGMFCGLRKGEIRGLKFKDFNLVNKTVKINRQISLDLELEEGSSKIISYKNVERLPKSESSIRILSLPDIIIKELNKREKVIEILKLNDKYIDKGYISVQENGKPSSSSALNNYLNRITKNNGISKISVHGLRHIFATLLIENDVPLPKISALLGHSSIHTTFDHYIDVINDKEKISDFMNDIYNEEDV